MKRFELIKCIWMIVKDFTNKGWTRSHKSYNYHNPSLSLVLMAPPTSHLGCVGWKISPRGRKNHSLGDLLMVSLKSCWVRPTYGDVLIELTWFGDCWTRSTHISFLFPKFTIFVQSIKLIMTPSIWIKLRVVHTQAILFLTSMSGRGGSGIERLWIWMTSFSINFSWFRNSFFNFSVFVYRIRRFPTLTSKIKWLGFELPLTVAADFGHFLPFQAQKILLKKTIL